MLATKLAKGAAVSTMVAFWLPQPSIAQAIDWATRPGLWEVTDFQGSDLEGPKKKICVDKSGRGIRDMYDFARTFYKATCAEQKKTLSSSENAVEYQCTALWDKGAHVPVIGFRFHIQPNAADHSAISAEAVAPSDKNIWSARWLADDCGDVGMTDTTTPGN